MRRYFKVADNPIDDLFWYLSDPCWPEPNIRFLGKALLQTNWKGPEIKESYWNILAAQRLKDINWEKAVEDTHPLIEKPSDL